MMNEMEVRDPPSSPGQGDPPDPPSGSPDLSDAEAGRSADGSNDGEAGGSADRSNGAGADLDPPHDAPPHDAPPHDATPHQVPRLAPAPEVVAELAEACVRFVEGAVGVKLDYEPETLPLLDHYLASHRADLLARPEAVGLIARAAGAYFGEVVRRHIQSFWHVPSDDPADWEIRARPVYLSMNPIAIAYDAIRHGDEEGPTSHFQLDDADREELEERLSELPAVSDEEFYSLSTRLEVLDIAVEAAKARMIRDGLGEVGFDPEDYES